MQNEMSCFILYFLGEQYDASAEKSKAFRAGVGALILSQFCDD